MMKIIFLGTPEFAVPSLKILVDNGYDIAAVITAPGKKAGRGLQIKEPAIKLYADDAQLKTYQPEKLSDPVFIEEIRSLKADLFIVVAFRMLPEKLWNMPPKGTFNLHSSLLPQYRGAAPINRVIMNGETQTGVTTFFLKHEIDTGNIIKQQHVNIGPDETAGELHDELMQIGAELVLDTVRAIELGTATAIKQDELVISDIKTAPKIFTPDCQLDWSQTAQQLHNQVRGLSPFPGAFTHLEDQNGNKMLLKIYRSAITPIPASKSTGTLTVEGSKLFIDCSDFRLEILEIQQEGKKRIKSDEFVRGFRTEKGWKAVSN